MTLRPLRMLMLMLPMLGIALNACADSTAGTAESTEKKTEKINNNTTVTTTPAPDMTAAKPVETNDVKVNVKTTAGDFTILLYGDTPRHRDNFIKLVKEGYYNGTLFHRVINEFMIQAGDPDSKNAAPGQALGSGGPGYTIEAEIIPAHFHKRGALAAARQGDQMNPERRSSGSQFYIVTGKKVAPGQLAQLEQGMKNQAMQTYFNDLAMKHRDEITRMQREADREGLSALQQKLVEETEQHFAALPSPLTDEMKKAYTEVGGAPHLDRAYTVFGEVLSGMDVIDKIEKTETDGRDRPKEDVRIISMSVAE